MSTKEKLIARFISLSTDFTFEELTTLLSYLGFSLNNKGKTSGSRVEFVSAIGIIILHKPHPGNVVKLYVLKQVKEYLTQKGLL